MKKLLLGFLAILAVIGLSACSETTENEPVKNNNTSESTVSEQKVDNTPEVSTALPDESVYDSIVKDYESALAELEASGDEVFVEDIIPKYNMLSETLVAHINRYSKNDVELTHSLYDIDKNGVNELLVGASGAVGAIYSINSATNQPVLVYSQSTLERGNLSIYDNGIIYSEGAGGAALHYYEFGKIAKDGSSYELLEDVEEEYLEGKETPQYKDATNGDLLEYTSLDEIESKYISGASKI